ncbi:MAG TPA: peptidylprolyl isomerase [Bacteroidales bacterium]|jgi:peptidyl-prolyl cis-trans isomerase SurA|nr:peptidylprolyl isomerase [Bacteroidales bacterium]
MKRIVLLFLSFHLLMGATVAQDNVVDEVVWVVGDEPILRSEVEGQRLRAQFEGVKFSGDPYCVIPEQIAVNKLFLHQADLDSVVVSDIDLVGEVDRRITIMTQRLGSREKIEEYFNMPMAKIRDMQRETIREEYLIERVKSSLLRSITVTPAEVRRYFNALPEDSIPMIPAQTEVEIITMEPQVDAANVESIKERLREFTERINQGESFSTLAVMYSEDRASARTGGELGFMGKGELLPEFANVAFSLNDPTKVSKIVETEYGFHIIQLIEKRGDRINVRHILLKPKVAADERNLALMRLDSIADMIRNDKVRFDEAARFLSHDKDTRNNGGLMVNPRTGTTRFELEDLPSEIGKVVYEMNVGEISRPFSMINTKDKEVSAIVRVKTKSKAHRATLVDDFQLMKQYVQSSKSEQMLTDWIREKQRKTYVRISENWRNCTFQYPGWIK